MTIYNFSIDNFDNNKVIDQISLNTKIQIERLSVDREVREKKLGFSNPLDTSKNYLVILDDKSLNKILYLDKGGKYVLLNHNALYIENKDSLLLNFLNFDDNIECIHFYVINDLLDASQKKYNHLMERHENQINNNIFIIDERDILSYEFCDELIAYLDNTEKTNVEKWESRQNVNCKFINIENIQDENDKKNFDDKLFNITGKVIQLV